MRKLGILVFTILFEIVNCSQIHAQDPQFTQFYSTPLHLNPAYTGGTGQARATLNYRNQWPGINANFVTYLASYDHYIQKLKGGVGFMVRNDQVMDGSSNIKSTDVNALYSHKVLLSETFALRLGLQAGIVSRSLGFNDYIYTDQLDNSGNISGTGEGASSQNKTYADFSTGALLHSKKTWVGVGIHHFNRPNISFFEQGSSDAENLDVRWSFHTGHHFSLKEALNLDRELTILPVFHYKSQGKSDQASLGCYLGFDKFVTGVWYRGLPIKKSDNTKINQDAFAFLIGFHTEKINIGYSYDLTTSELSTSTRGAHEISLTYQFEVNHGYGRQPNGGFHLRHHRIDCPNPWKRVSHDLFKKKNKRKKKKKHH